MNEQLSLEDTESRIRLESAWQRVLGRISGEVQEPIMARFIRPLSPVSFDDGIVRLCAPGRFLQEWVRERFSGILQSYLSDELGQSVQLEVLAKPREKSDFAVTKGAYELYGKNYAIVGYPGMNPAPPNYPPSADAAMVKIDLSKMGADRARILAEWTKRYDGKSAAK